MILGLPGSYLNQKQFYDTSFLKESPFLSVLMHNPNHIGCHTYNKGEKYFLGTQQLELELLQICAEEILGAKKREYDGYVATGGTEANIQAQWIYRNYFMKEKGALISEIGVVFTEDAHYSVYKGANLLGISPICVKVDADNRRVIQDDLKNQLKKSSAQGIKYIIVHLSMGTTMFGSIDDADLFLDIARKDFCNYFVHVDAAFGGFIYPFSSPKKDLCFKNPEISSITIDAHKMLQSPYGTGIFLCRKGLIDQSQTSEAAYVYGSDFTLCGSRSGANAVAIWMILMSYGSVGLTDAVTQLISRTDFICHKLVKMKVEFYRNPHMNIVSIKSPFIFKELAEKYNLVADNYHSPKWWKIVVMPHVTTALLSEFINDLDKLNKCECN
ncbi:pyridoxal phosphate-dependent decarboxylase family protein [Chryseobacterium sp. S90]|uniref:pyridoxal phosphate-dependent decarboxylase family protein n=1 Tax=Chryseobacterium sp. S90 TaxID=3395373 RepID=UPI0039BCF632